MTLLAAAPGQSRLSRALRVRLRPLLYRVALTALASAGIALEHGFDHPPMPVDLIHLLQALLLLAYGIDVAVRQRQGRPPLPDAGPMLVDYVLIALAVLGGALYLLELGGTPWMLLEISAAGLFFIELWRLNIGLSQKLRHPGILLPTSFLCLIAIGTLLIKVPVAIPPGHELSWLDALFTMTSAVCVTGLTVRDTATGFTPFGQTLIGVFMQLGGLGILIFGSMLAVLLGRQLSLRENVSLSQMLHDQPLQDVTRLVRLIVGMTILIELIGAVMLYPLWEAPPGQVFGFRERAGMSLFHAVSAFCNAGFDITGRSLIPHRYSLLSHGVITLLVVLGGLGFPVLDNFYRIAKGWVMDRWNRLKQRPLERNATGPMSLASRRMSLHTKIVLTTTAAVYLCGVLAIAAGQIMPYFYEAMQQGVTAHVQRPEPMTLGRLGRILADASFMSVAARTAGFTTVPMEDIQPAGIFTLMMLMAIGGSPGSTAGGIKTTVVAVLVLSVLATIRQRRETEAFGRTISDAIVRRAGTLGICYVLSIALAILLLTLSEPAPFQRIVFEVISAASTAGLSLGLTPGLTSFGKLVIIATMFLGRVGPLTLMGALVLIRRPTRPYAYAHEEVVLG